MNDETVDNRTFTVYDGKILQLPALTIADLRIASSSQGKAFVLERIHDEEMNGFPLVEYNLLGYTLIFDETTVFHTLSPRDESSDAENPVIGPQKTDESRSGALSSVPNRQEKLDVLGMEVA